MFESESVFAFAKYHYLASFPRFLNVSSLIKLHLGEIRLKNKSHPPLTKQKLTLTSPHLLIILRSIPPLPCILLTLVPSYLIYVLDVFLRHKKVLQMTQMTSLNNQTVFIYIVQFIAIKFLLHDR